MASITIRNLDEATKRRLRIRAAEHGWSMEEEVRRILREAVGKEAPRRNLATEIRAQVEAAGGGVDLELPERTPMRDPIRFD
ncbi:MAG: FitA-like ribbon-helix-helix domain-containing protein [Oceanicaulis sp.]